MRLLCSLLIVALSARAALASDMRGLSVAVALDAVHGSEQFELPLNDEEMPIQAAQFCVTHANKFDVVFGGERRRCELAVLKLAYVALQRSKLRFAFNVTLDGTTHVVEVYKNDTAASAAEHFLRSLGVFTTENAAVLQGEIERLARTDDGTGSLVVDDAAAGEEEAPSAAAEHVAANAAAAGGSSSSSSSIEQRSRSRSSPCNTDSTDTQYTDTATPLPHQLALMKQRLAPSSLQRKKALKSWMEAADCLFSTVDVDAHWRAFVYHHPKGTFTLFWFLLV